MSARTCKTGCRGFSLSPSQGERAGVRGLFVPCASLPDLWSGSREGNPNKMRCDRVRNQRYLSAMNANPNPKQWTNVDKYIDEVVVHSDDVLTAALEACAAAGLPPISVSPSQGKLLQLIAQIQGVRTIL